MDNLVRSVNSNRYVIEDSIPKVTADGEPHEMLTMIAVVSGLVAAIIVLFVLVMLIDCRQHTQGPPQDEESASVSKANVTKIKSNSVMPHFSTPKSTANNNGATLLSVATISAAINADRNLACSSELNQLDSTELTHVSFPGITTIRC